MTLKFTRYDLLGIAAVAAIATLGVDPAFAQAATTGAGASASGISGAGGLTNTGFGGGFADVVGQALRGNIGLAVGVAFAALGAYLWLVKQETAAGIGSILFGAILALVPNLMTGLFNNITSPIVNTLVRTTNSQ